MAIHAATTDRGELSDVLKKVTDLSGLPEVTQKVISVATSEDSDAGDLEDAIKFDPALVTRLIRVANSAYYAQQAQISNVHAAVILLGFDTIKNIALAVSIADLFKGETGIEGYSRGALWQGMVSTAATARMIARRIRYSDHEEAFLAGMMMDIGVILEDQHLHDGFKRAVFFAKSGQTSLYQAEQQVFGWDHAYVGARLARAWNFPKSVRQAIAFHHQPEKSGDDARKFTMLCHLSDALCRTILNLPTGDPGKPNLHRDTLTVLGLKPLDVKVIHQDLKKELESVQAFYSLIS